MPPLVTPSENLSQKPPCKDTPPLPIHSKGCLFDGAPLPFVLGSLSGQMPQRFADGRKQRRQALPDGPRVPGQI
jgi:hypothetical protein